MFYSHNKIHKHNYINTDSIRNEERITSEINSLYTTLTCSNPIKIFRMISEFEPVKIFFFIPAFSTTGS